jgi:hypothetical protein
MRQLAKIEDLEARSKPKKTGFERREPSPYEKSLARRAKELSESLGLVKKGQSVEARMKARRTRLANEIKELEGRIERGEFSPKERVPLPADPEAVRLKAEKERVRRRFEKAKEQERLKNRTLLAKGIDAAKEVLDLPRALMSAFDFSAVRRQGGFFTSGHPLKAAKHIKTMFRAFASPAVSEEVDVMIRDPKLREHAELGEAAGLDLTTAETEEAIKSRLSDKIPGIPASNRAYTT